MKFLLKVLIAIALVLVLALVLDLLVGVERKISIRATDGSVVTASRVILLPKMDEPAGIALRTETRETVFSRFLARKGESSDAGEGEQWTVSYNRNGILGNPLLCALPLHFYMSPFLMAADNEPMLRTLEDWSRRDPGVPGRLSAFFASPDEAEARGIFNDLERRFMVN